MRLPLITVLCALVVLPQVAQAKTVAQCDMPEGLDQFFRGELLLSPAAVKGGASVALVEADDEYDLVLHLANGDLRSVRALGGAVDVAVGEDGHLHHALVEQDGYRDHFLFRTPAAGDGKLVWATQRVSGDGKGLMISAACPSS